MRLFFKPFKFHLQLTYLFVKFLYEFIGVLVFVVITCKYLFCILYKLTLLSF